VLRIPQALAALPRLQAAVDPPADGVDVCAIL
jgi:hypothetical protein